MGTGVGGTSWCLEKSEDWGAVDANCSQPWWHSPGCTGRSAGLRFTPWTRMVLPASFPATVPSRTAAVALWSLSPWLAGLFLAQELPGFGDAAAHWLLRVPWGIGQAWAGKGGLCLAPFSLLSLTPGNILGGQQLGWHYALFCSQMETGKCC